MCSYFSRGSRFYFLEIEIGTRTSALRIGKSKAQLLRAVRASEIFASGNCGLAKSSRPATPAEEASQAPPYHDEHVLKRPEKELCSGAL